MLIINNNECKITKQQVWVGTLIVNKSKGYDINIKLEFNNANKEGFINLSVGYEKVKQINKFINNEYIGIPFDVPRNQINFFEVYDTNIFLDTEIDSEIRVSLKKIIDNKIEAHIQLNDDLINIEYEGYLDIIDLK